MGKIIIFGIGQYYKGRKSIFEPEEIIAFVDNNIDMQGQNFDGKMVYSPEEIYKLEYDYICIMTGYQYSVEIKKQLENLGVASDRIGTFEEYFAQKEDKKIEIIKQNNVDSSDVLFFLPNSNNTGGFRAALYAIQAMVNCGYTVTVITTCKGNGFQELLSKNLDIVITPDISNNNDYILKLLKVAKVIFVNAINFAYFISNILYDKKVIWWIHTGALGFKNAYIPSNINNSKNLSVYGVSEISCNEFKKRIKDVEIKRLPFGIPEELPTIHKDISTSKMVFAIIGNIMYIKGIDIIIDAIKSLTSEECEGLEIWIIGGEQSNKYNESVKHQSQGIDCIKWLGYRNHDEVIRLLGEIDVLVSASREDMLPIVISEAMMNTIPCIVSNSVGTADFIEDYHNGILFESEDSNDLCKKIRWALNNKESMKNIGKQGRKLFKEEFSFEVFSKRIKKIIEENINENISSL